MQHEKENEYIQNKKCVDQPSCCSTPPKIAMMTHKQFKRPRTLSDKTFKKSSKNAIQNHSSERCLC